MDSENPIGELRMSETRIIEEFHAFMLTCNLALPQPNQLASKDGHISGTRREKDFKKKVNGLGFLSLC